MNRYRTMINLLLGLTLLLQGFAVSATPRSVAQVESADTVSVVVALPCHGTMDVTGQSVPRNCCDPDAPSMTSCLLGHLGSVAVFDLQFVPISATAPSYRAVPTLTQPPTTPLRPPKVLHA